MANILDRFNKEVAGSKGKDIDITATFSSSGDFIRTSGLQTIMNSWNTILTTPRGSYDHDPLFGSNLHKYIFEPADNKTSNKIKHEIENSILTYDNRANITKIDVSFLPNKKGFSINIKFMYEDQEDTLKILFNEDTLIKLLQ